MTIFPVVNNGPFFAPLGHIRPELRANETLFGIFLEKGINYCDQQGNSLLHIAASMNDEIWVHFLCEIGCHPSLRNLHGDTPLHIAARQNNSGIIEQLSPRILRLGGSLDATNIEGYSALHLAAGYNALHAIDRLCAHGADKNLINPQNGCTPLLSAIFFRHPHAVELLLCLKVSPNIQNRYGCTVTHAAMHLGHKEIVELLLKHNALMYENEIKETPVHIAARMGRIDILALFYERGIPLNQPNKDGYTPIHLAAIEGHEECCLFLLYKTAHFSESSCGINCLLTIATKKKLERLVENLAPYCQNINSVDDDGYTTLDWAIMAQSPSIVEILLRNGADLTFRSNLEKPILYRAIESRNIDIVKLCINNNPSIINIRGSGESTPYICAVELGYTELLAHIPADEYSLVYLRLKQLSHVAGISGTFSHPKGTFKLEIDSIPQYSLLCSAAIPEEFKDLRVEFTAASNRHRSNEEILSAISSGRTTIINAGWEDHHIVLVIQNNLMIICNRGQREQDISSFKSYIIDPKKITSALISEINRKNDLKPYSEEEGELFFYRTLPQLISQSGMIVDAATNSLCKAVELIAPKDQKIDNCAAASVKTAVRAAIVLSILRIKQASFGIPDLYYAKQVSKDISTAMRHQAEQKCIGLIHTFPSNNHTIYPVVMMSIFKRFKRNIVRNCQAAILQPLLTSPK